MSFEGKIKGVHLQNVIEYVKHKRGILGLNEFFRILNDGRALPDLIKEDSLVPKDWYPYELYLVFMRTADQVVGNGDLSKCFDIGYQTVQNLGHLSYLARSPDVFEFIDNAISNWNNVYDFGNPEYTKAGDKKIIIIYKGFPEDKAKCEYFRGSLAGMLKLCGLDGNVETGKCSTEGHTDCEYIITWK